jgi:hypothetical protein
MELFDVPGGYAMDKEENSLDRFVLDYVSMLDKHKVKYVIVSGYVAILFGRSRSSEDVDMFVEKMGKERFLRLWADLTEKFECINTSDSVDAYDEYLLNACAIRFSYKGKYVPNMEVKFPKSLLDRWVFDDPLKVVLNKRTLYVSPMEVQIPYKLFLGTDKDIEDARHLYHIFKDRMDINLWNKVQSELKTEKLAERYLP